MEAEGTVATLLWELSVRPFFLAGGGADSSEWSALDAVLLRKLVFPVLATSKPPASTAALSTYLRASGGYSPFGRKYSMRRVRHSTRKALWKGSIR